MCTVAPVRPTNPALNTPTRILPIIHTNITREITALHSCTPERLALWVCVFHHWDSTSYWWHWSHPALPGVYPSVPLHVCVCGSDRESDLPDQKCKLLWSSLWWLVNLIGQAYSSSISERPVHNIIILVRLVAAMWNKVTLPVRRSMKNLFKKQFLHAYTHFNCFIVLLRCRAPSLMVRALWNSYPPVALMWSERSNGHGLMPSGRKEGVIESFLFRIFSLSWGLN